MSNWPKVSATVERRFSATHALPGVRGGGPGLHSHDYVARFGFTHEVQPTTGLAGSKSLEDWVESIDSVVARVAGQNLNEALAPFPPTLEILAVRLLSLLPAYFDSVEVAAYDPQYTVRVERRGIRIEWPA